MQKPCNNNNNIWSRNKNMCNNKNHKGGYQKEISQCTNYEGNHKQASKKNLIYNKE